MEEVAVYGFGVPTSYIYILVGIVILLVGFYLYKKYKSKK